MLLQCMFHKGYLSRQILGYIWKRIKKNNNYIVYGKPEALRPVGSGDSGVSLGNTHLSISGFSKSSIRRHRRTFLCPTWDMWHEPNLQWGKMGTKWNKDLTFRHAQHITILRMIVLNLWQGNFGPSPLHVGPRDHSLCAKMMRTRDNYRAPVITSAAQIH